MITQVIEQRQSENENFSKHIYFLSHYLCLSLINLYIWSIITDTFILIQNYYESYHLPNHRPRHYRNFFLFNSYYPFSSVDIDADVDVDADISSVVSFKGLTHFGIGFGWYMYLVGNADIASYAIGILVGLFFVFAVWFLYKKAYQLQQVNRSEETDQLVGRECTIYFKQSDNKYTVQTSRDGAMREVDVISETGKAYQTGDKTIISSYKDGTLYIK